VCVLLGSSASANVVEWARSSSVAVSWAGDVEAAVVYLTTSGLSRRARLAPAIVVQRAAFSSMLRSVSCTLAGGVTWPLAAGGREKLGGRVRLGLRGVCVAWGVSAVWGV
jgi:hypothetical protein